MKTVLFFSLFIFFSSVKSQITEIKTFSLAEYNKLKEISCPENCDVKTYYNKNFITYKKNDSVIDMSYQKDNISSINVKHGNYGVNFQFHPNLKIKTKQEYIYGISQIGHLQIGIEKEYDEKGKLISEFNWEKVPYDDNIPGPKKTIWEIRNQLIEDFNFDLLNDKNLFSVHVIQNKKSKKVNYIVQKFISDENKILKLLTFEYDGETAKFIESENTEIEIPEGLVHY